MLWKSKSLKCLFYCSLSAINETSVVTYNFQSKSNHIRIADMKEVKYFKNFRTIIQGKNSNEALQIHLISYFFLHIYFLWGSFSLSLYFFLVNSIMGSSFHCLSFNISCCNEMTWFSKCGLYLSGLQSYHIFSLARLVTIAFLPCPPLLYIVLQGFKVLSRQ